MKAWRWWSLLVLATALMTGQSAMAQVERYVAGTHYTVLPDLPALQELQPRGTKPEVVEIFWYGCPHCYAFDPLLAAWVQKHGDAIAFSRRPMIWNAITKQHARMFYTAQALGMGEKLHKTFFDSIHQQHNYLQDIAAVRPLFAAAGVPAQQFDGTFTGFAVEALVRKNEALVTAMQVPSVPAMLVNGKFLVHVHEQVPSHDAMLQVVEFLLDKH